MRTDEDAARPPVAVEARREGLFHAATWRRVPVPTILATVGIVVAVYLAGKVLYRLRDLVLVMIVGGFVAVLLDPLVVALEHSGVHRRGVAVTIITLGALLVFGALAFAFGYPLVHGITHFAESLPRYVRDAQQGHGWIGHLVKRYHVEDWVTKNSPKLVSFAQSLTKPVLALGKGTLSILLSLITMFIFVILLLLEAPKMRAAILGWLSPTTAARWSRFGGEVTRSVAGYMLGNLATSLIGGVIVLVTLTVLSVPYALLWALWVALVDFLPEVGGALAGIPTVLFAFTHSLTAGIVTAVVFVAFWQIENRLLNPVVMSRTVRINPLLIFLAVVFAAAIGSWVGGVFGGFAAALIAIPGAAAGQALVRELRPGTPAAPAAVAEQRSAKP